MKKIYETNHTNSEHYNLYIKKTCLYKDKSLSRTSRTNAFNETMFREILIPSLGHLSECSLVIYFES